MESRSFNAFIIFCVALLIIVGNLFWIQIIKGEEYRLKAERNQLSDTVIAANRGTIYDSNMKVIAQSASAWLVYINPSKITTDEQKQLLVDGFVDIFELDKETVEKKVNREQSGYEKIIGQIDNNKKTELQEYLSAHKDQKLGTIVGIDPDTKRYYPLGSFASTIIGFTGSEDIGRSGLELKYNNELTGEAGRIITAKNALSGDMPNDYETTYDARQGYSLVLTIDEVIQYYLEQQLAQAVTETQAKYAYGIVMDVKTGAILGMSTMPDYDLNSPYKIHSDAVIKEIQEMEDDNAKAQAETNALYAQWRNRTVTDSYEPGSTFKLFVAAAALEEGIMTTDTTYNCTSKIKVADYYQNCFNHKAHGTQTVAEALPNSCNTFFITMGQKLGAETFSKYFEAFGFTEKTGIDLSGETQPRAGSAYHRREDFNIAQLSSYSFGQTFEVTPLQMEQFAKMGSVYMEHIMGVKNPKVGIVNIGAEEEKGNALVKETFPQLKALPGINFIGSVEARENKRPIMSDLRESGSIEQDADIVMFLYRDDYYNPDSEKKNIAEVIMAKHRAGSTGTVELLWMGNYTKFANIERYRE